MILTKQSLSQIVSPKTTILLIASDQVTSLAYVIDLLAQRLAAITFNELVKYINGICY